MTPRRFAKALAIAAPLLLFLSTVFFRSAQSAAAASPSTLSSACTEAEAVEMFQAIVMNESFETNEGAWKKGYCKGGIVDAMEQGRWELSEAIITECVAKGVKVASSVYKAGSSIRKRVTEMQNLMSRKPKGKLNFISPAMQWGQNANFIFVNVKFAHKMDTPATLGVKSDNVTLSDFGLFFEATSKSKNKRFKLDLTFPRQIIPEESTWSMGAVGRATFELKKRWPRTKWSKFLKGKTPANMHVWWAMKEQYASELGSLDGSNSDESAKKMEEDEAKKMEEEEAKKRREMKEKMYEEKKKREEEIAAAEDAAKDAAEGDESVDE